MSSRPPIVEAAAAAAATLVAWRLLRYYLTPDPYSKLPGPPPESWANGNLFQFFNPNAWDFHEELAQKYGSFFRLHGFLGRGHLLHTYDPKAIYHLLIKDQNTFDETQNFLLMNTLIFGKGLLSTEGVHIRSSLFIVVLMLVHQACSIENSGKCSTLSFRLLICATKYPSSMMLATKYFRFSFPRTSTETYFSTSKLRDSILRQVSNGPREIDMLSWMTRTALELIGQSGLGYSFDPLTEDGQEHPFSTSVKELMKSIGKFMFSRFYVLPWAHKIGSPGFQRFIIKLLPWKDLHDMRDIVDTMHNTSTEIIQAKKRALLAGGDAIESEVGRVKANMAAAEEDRLTEGELLGQMSTITFAAMDTTSNALSRVLQLLSENPDIQTRLREEIREARQLHGDLQYDELVALPLLDAVCRETLRLHPPVPFVVREAMKDGVIPLSTPITTTDGKELNEVIVPRGTATLISIWACNRNPAVWGPDAKEWKPDRWLSPLPESVVDAHIPGVYSHLMTFIGGSRSCIGFKFSQLEMKVILSLLLESFQFAPTDKKVFWQLNGVVQPSLDKDGAKLQLPLKVSLAPPAPSK
ncbi:hypothetical protein H1R20_g14187, partial [Candolleomyces eurysporus]